MAPKSKAKAKAKASAMRGDTQKSPAKKAGAKERKQAEREAKNMVAAGGKVADLAHEQEMEFVREAVHPDRAVLSRVLWCNCFVERSLVSTR